MKYAMVNGVKTEAAKALTGYCQRCESEVIAKCGNIRIHHWAHKGKLHCDLWWENETEWHRSWKEHFPSSWQETVQFAASGEKHIADVKTAEGWVLEFQRSFLVSEERAARNAFYTKLVWVVDATRRSTDQKQFQRLLSDSPLVVPQLGIRRVYFPEECRLLNEWASDTSLAFFDFGMSEESHRSQMWFLFPSVGDRSAYIAPFARLGFIAFHRENKFDKFYGDVIVGVMALLREQGPPRFSGPDLLSMLPRRNRRRLRF